MLRILGAGDQTKNQLIVFGLFRFCSSSRDNKLHVCPRESQHTNRIVEMFWELLGCSRTLIFWYDAVKSSDEDGFFDEVLECEVVDCVALNGCKSSRIRPLQQGGGGPKEDSGASPVGRFLHEWGREKGKSKPNFQQLFQEKYAPPIPIHQPHSEEGRMCAANLNWNLHSSKPIPKRKVV